jgi:tetratricopeptide (TPR) repeat protein
VAGRAFEFDLVRGISLCSDAETARALDGLLTRQFLLEEGTAYRFSHAHIAEVAYATIGSAMRRVLHQRAADILRTHLQRPEMYRGVPLHAAIAHHLEQALQTEEAATFWLTAGQHAWELFAAEEALNAFARGLACIATGSEPRLGILRFDVLAGQEDVLHHLGRRAEQQAALAAMEQLVAVMSQEVDHPPSATDQTGASAALALRQREVAWRQGRFFIALNQWYEAESALRQSVEVQRMAHLLPDETSLCLLATALIHQRRCIEAQSVAEAALQQAIARNDASAQAGCLLTLSEIASELEDLNTSERYLHMALEQAQAATDPVTQAHLVANLAAIEFQRGRFEAALDHAQEAVQLHHAQANREGEARSHVLSAICLARLLRYGEALDAYACARESYRTIQQTQGLAAATVNAAVLAGRLGDLERSLELGREAHALFTKIDDERGICAAASNVGGVLFFLGQSSEAEQWLREALERATTLALPMQQSSALLNLGGALLQQARVDEARTMLDQGLAIRQTLGHVDVCATLAYLALACLRLNDLESAEALSRQAVEQLDTTGGVEHPQQVFFARAQVLQLLGRTDEAQQALDHAHQLLQQVLDSLATLDEQQRYVRAFTFNRDLMAAFQKDQWPIPPRLA